MCLLSLCLRRRRRYRRKQEAEAAATAAGGMASFNDHDDVDHGDDYDGDFDDWMFADRGAFDEKVHLRPARAVVHQRVGDSDYDDDGDLWRD